MQIIPDSAFRLENSVRSVLSSSGNVQNITELMDWVESPLLDLLYATQEFPSGANATVPMDQNGVMITQRSFMYRSIITLGALIVQTRYELAPCPPHLGYALPRMYCIGRSLSTDTSMNVAALMRKFPTNLFFRTYCGSPDNSPVPVERCDPRATRHVFHPTGPGAYNKAGGGFVVVVPSNGVSPAEIQLNMQYLRSVGWIDHLTNSLDVRLLLHNPSLSLSVITHIRFRVTDAGLVSSTIQCTTFDPYLYRSGTNYVRAVLEVLFICIVLVKTILAIRGIVRERMVKKLPWTAIVHSWERMELLLLAVYYVLIGTWLNLMFLYKEFDKQLRLINDLVAAVQWYTGNLNAIGLMIRVRKYVVYVCIVLMMERTMARLHWHPRMNLFNRTLRVAGSAVLHFLPVISLIFLGFTFLSHLTFGNATEDMSSVSSTLRTLFSILMGTEDSSVFGVSSAGDPIGYALANVIYVSFVMFVTYILMSMFLAIIVDAYADVQNSVRNEPSLLLELRMLGSYVPAPGPAFREVWRRVLLLCRSHKAKSIPRTYFEWEIVNIADATFTALAKEHSLGTRIEEDEVADALVNTCGGHEEEARQLAARIVLKYGVDTDDDLASNWTTMDRSASGMLAPVDDGSYLSIRSPLKKPPPRFGSSFDTVVGRQDSLIDTDHFQSRQRSFAGEQYISARSGDSFSDAPSAAPPRRPFRLDRSSTRSIIAHSRRRSLADSHHKGSFAFLQPSPPHHHPNSHSPSPNTDTFTALDQTLRPSSSPQPDQEPRDHPPAHAPTGACIETDLAVIVGGASAPHASECMCEGAMTSSSPREKRPVERTLTPQSSFTYDPEDSGAVDNASGSTDPTEQCAAHGRYIRCGPDFIALAHPTDSPHGPLGHDTCRAGPEREATQTGRHVVSSTAEDVAATARQSWGRDMEGEGGGRGAGETDMDGAGVDAYKDLPSSAGTPMLTPSASIASSSASRRSSLRSAMKGSSSSRSSQASLSPAGGVRGSAQLRANVVRFLEDQSAALAARASSPSRVHPSPNSEPDSERGQGGDGDGEFADASGAGQEVDRDPPLPPLVQKSVWLDGSPDPASISMVGAGAGAGNQSTGGVDGEGSGSESSEWSDDAPEWLRQKQREALEPVVVPEGAEPCDVCVTPPARDSLELIGVIAATHAGAGNRPRLLAKRASGATVDGPTETSSTSASRRGLIRSFARSTKRGRGSFALPDELKSEDDGTQSA